MDQNTFEPKSGAESFQAVPAQAPKQRGLLVPVLLTAVIAASATYGAVYAWQKYMTTPEPTAIVPATSQVSSAKEQEIQMLKDKLLYAKFQIWMEQLGVGGAQHYRDEAGGNKMYFVLSEGDGTTQAFRLYDYRKDELYAKDGEISLLNTSPVIYQEVVPSGNVDRLVGVYNNQLVYFETGKEDSPGPCFHPLLSESYKFYSLDLTKSPAVKQPFKPSAQLVSEVSAEQ